MERHLQEGVAEQGGGRGPLQGVHRSAQRHKVLELRTPLPAGQARLLGLRDDEQHAHGVQVGVRRPLLRHLDRRDACTVQRACLGVGLARVPSPWPSPTGLRVSMSLARAAHGRQGAWAETGSVSPMAAWKGSTRPRVRTMPAGLIGQASIRCTSRGAAGSP